jgi:hypothetical protein
MSKIVVREVEAGEHAAWESLVESSPDGSVYALPKYLQVLAETTGAQWRLLGAWRGEELVGGLPVFERRTVVGRFVSPRLLLYYNGFVLRRKSTRYPSERTADSIKVVEALEDALRDRGLAHVTLRSRATITDLRPLLSRGWTAAPSWTYVVRFDDLEQAQARVEGNFRRLIRRCEREGFRLVEDDDFDRFFELHLETKDRKGISLYLPLERFRTYFTRLREAGLARLYHARTAEGESAAAQLVLLGHPVTHSVCAGADPRWLRSGASVFLRWQVCEALAAEGFQANDLTDATLNPVSRFKSQLGAELQLCLVTSGPSTIRWKLRTAGRSPRAIAKRLRSAFASRNGDR